MTPQGRESFKAEFVKLKSLKHPNILKVYEMVEGQDLIDGTLQDQVFVITDLARGGDLHSYMRKVIEHSAVTEEWVAGVFKQALRGVAYLHRLGGIIHNDIKPENILVMDEFSQRSPNKIPTVVLTDFGRAQFHRDQHFVHGDPRYQSPETWKVLTDLWSDNNYADLDLQTGAKADVWSLGATLFELLSGGCLPFLYQQCDLDTFMEGDAMIDRMRDALASDEPVRLVPYCRTASAHAMDLLTLLLDKDPQRRPSAEKVLQHQWFFQHGRPLSSHVTCSLKYYATKGRAHAMLLSALSMKLQSDHYKRMGEVFAAINSKHSGEITFPEFKSAFEGGVLSLSGATPERLRSMFNAADVDQNGKLNFNEFVAVTFDWHSLDHHELDRHLLKLFDELDRHGHGHINSAQLSRVFQGTLDRAMLQDTFAMADADGDGKISKDDLKNFLFTPASREDLERILRHEQRSSLGCFAGVASALCGNLLQFPWNKAAAMPLEAMLALQQQRRPSAMLRSASELILVPL